MIHGSTTLRRVVDQDIESSWAKSSRIFLTSCPVCQEHFPHPRPQFREILATPPVPRYQFERWMWRT